MTLSKGALLCKSFETTGLQNVLYVNTVRCEMCSFQAEVASAVAGDAYP